MAMNLYSVTFHGLYPVPTAAVVVEADENKALDLFWSELEFHHPVLAQPEKNTNETVQAHFLADVGECEGSCHFLSIGDY